LTDFMVVSKTVGKGAFVKRLELLFAKYPEVASYLKNHLGGPHLERWGMVFFQLSRARLEQQAVAQVRTRITNLGTRDS
jgi:hypothetical protein